MSLERTAAAGRRRRGLEAALLLAAAVLFGEVCTLPLALAARAGVAGAPPGWLLPLDDAYIFVRYAQQAARGRPWQWNTGEPSTGASSALWPWLLVPPHWISRELAVWSLWSRWLGVASLWALGLAAARALRAARLPEPWPLACGLCLVWSGPIGFGAVAGMESAANAALLVLAGALWMESLDGHCGAAPARRSVRVWALVVTALLPLGRPENGVLTLLAALALLAYGGRWIGGDGAARKVAGARGRASQAGGAGGSGDRGSRHEGAGGAGPGGGSVHPGRGLPWPRWAGIALLLPGMLLAWCDWRATGYLEPAGALVKSWLHVPFLPLGARIASYLAVLRRGLLPVYLGTKPTALWPPVGLVAIATAAAALYAVLGGRGARAVRSGGRAPAARTPLPALAPVGLLAPLAVAWLALAAMAPLSTLLLWQEMRHHHSGLALAWVLAFAGAGLAFGKVVARRGQSRQRRQGGARAEPGESGDPGESEECGEGGQGGGEGDEGRSSRWPRAPLVLPLLLVAAFPHWARESARGAVQLYRGHARAAAWLGTHAHEQTLLLTDAGLLAVAHDGPAIDALGLASPDLTEAALNGPGALVASLARRRALPEIAAVEPALLKLPVLGEPLLPGPAPPGEITVLAQVRQDLLAGAAREGPGLDFAYLPDERRHHLSWHPPPLPRASFALLLPAPAEAGGGLALRGCRSLLGSLEIELPPGIAEVRLRAAVLPPDGEGEVVVLAGDEAGPAGRPIARGRLLADRWSDVAMTLPAQFAARLWLARRGPGIPCLASLRYFGRR